MSSDQHLYQETEAMLVGNWSTFSPFLTVRLLAGTTMKEGFHHTWKVLPLHSQKNCYSTFHHSHFSSFTPRTSRAVITVLSSTSNFDLSCQSSRLPLQLFILHRLCSYPKDICAEASCSFMQSKPLIPMKMHSIQTC